VRLPKKRLAGRVSAAGFIEISAKKKDFGPYGL
jgi:hypothetical protein